MKASMDDLFVISSSTKGTQLLLNRCTQVLTWAAAKVKLLKDSIYEEAVLIFGHPLTKEIKLSGKSRRTIQSIKLINQKNLLVAQISSASNPSQHAALQELLSATKEKIRVMRRAERRCRKRLVFKKGQAAFRANPYAAGKALLDPKSKATLRVDQRSLDEHKSSAIQDKLYDVPLSNLDGLPPSPPCSKPFPSSSLKYKDFLTLLATRRNASSPGLNSIPYKVYKKCPQINTFLFNVFKSCLM